MHLGIDLWAILVEFRSQVVPSWKLVALKSRWKIHPKSFRRFHIARKAFQEAPKRESLIFQWFLNIFRTSHFQTKMIILAGLEAFLGHLEAILGRTWAGLGRSWAILVALGSVLGRSWAVLGPSWALLDSSWVALGRSWVALGRS